MIVELHGGPFDGEMLDVGEVAHDVNCPPGCDVPELEIVDDRLGLKARYFRCATCQRYEYLDPNDEDDEYLPWNNDDEDPS